MTDARARLGRLAGTMLDGARAARDRARALRDEFRTSDEPERALVAPLLPGQVVRYVGLDSVHLPDDGRAGEAIDVMAGELAGSLDPRVLFGLLHIVNPVVWVDAVLTPARMVAGALLLPGRAAAAGLAAATRPVPGQAGPDRPAAAGAGSGPDDNDRQSGVDRSPPDGPPRPPIPLSPEHEAFRAAFRLDRYRPLADQLAEIAYRRRHVFSGDLASLAGTLLLFLHRHTGTPIAVTDTHLHLLRMGRRPDPDRPDHRRPRLLCGIPRSRITRIDSAPGRTRLLRFPVTIGFDDGSWLRIVQHALPDDRARFLAAVRELPGDRPGGGR